MKFYSTYDNDMYGIFFVLNKSYMFIIYIYIYIINYTFETGLMCMFWPFRSYISRRYVQTTSCNKNNCATHEPRVLIFINSL